MELINNTTKTLRDDLSVEIKEGSKLSIAAACFSIYAFQELKKQLSDIDELRFIFTSPTFITEKAKKEKREFYIPRLNRERSLYGTEFEIKLRNELTQKAIAKECAEWIKKKVSFKSNISDKTIQGGIVVDDVGYTPINNFTTIELGCEKGNVISTTIVKDNSLAKTLLADFNEIWNDNKVLQEVTDEVIDSITAAYNENSPDFIYFVTLYNIFNEFLEDVSEDVLPNEATGFKDSKIWSMLYNFQKDAALAIINNLVENLESNGRFHTDWLNFIYPRLKIAKDLLSDEGVIFISIDDNEVTNLKKICDEIFGSSNHCGTFIVNSTPNARDYGHIGKMHEYCLFYAKNMEYTQTNMLPDTDKKFKYSDAIGGFNIHPLYNSNEAFHKLNRPNLYYPFYLYLDEKQLINGDEFFNIGLEPKENSVEIYPPKSVKNGVQFVWRWGKEKAMTYMNQEIIGYKVGSNEYRIVQKMRHSEKIIRSMLLDTKYSSRRGTAEVEEILNGKIFSFPKPAALLYDFVRVGLSEDDYILDFFSGSATSAQAVMQLNAEDGGKRKFIMVQLPEKTDAKSEAYKAGYKNICEIGKERIRRAVKKIKEDSPLTTQGLDTGFRVLKCDTSNMKDVYYNPAEYEPSLFTNLEDNIKEDRTSEDLLFQVMLDLGVLLSSKIEETSIAGKRVFNVEDNYLIACFDDNVTEEAITEIAKQKPYYFVMRDSSMANDSVATNFEQIFAAYSPDTVRKVL